MSDNAVRGTKGAPAAAGVTWLRRRGRVPSRSWDVLAVISAGGALGAFARYAVSLAWPTPPGGFPGSTLLINTLGCALIGVLMVLVTDVWSAHRLVRPFLATGVLGGFTTFSMYAVEIQRLIDENAARTGLVYLVVTPVAALAAVWFGVVTTRQAARRRVHGRA